MGGWGRSGLFDIEFQSALVGIAVGGTGIAAVTTDGGARWESAELASNDLFGVSSPDGCTSVVISGQVPGYRTADDGATWDTVLFEGAGDEWAGSALAFFDDQSGIAVGGFPGFGGLYGAGVLATADGGRTWSANYQPEFSFGDPLYGASIAGQRAIVVGADGTVAYTGDRAETWETALDIGFEQDLHAVHVYKDGRGIAVGAGGTILLTPNGGATWRQTTSGTEADLWGVSCGRSTCLVVGDNGTVLRSNDGGTSWESVDVGTESHLYGVYVGLGS